FDELIQKVDEADRDIFRKYPSVREQIEDLSNKYQEAESYVSRWENWKSNSWDDEAKTTKDSVAALRERDNRIAELEAREGTEMNWDEIKAKIDEDYNKRGLVSKADLSDEKKLAELGLVRKETVDNLGYGMQSYYAKTAPFLTSHMQEFGENLDMEGFQKY